MKKKRFKKEIESLQNQIQILCNGIGELQHKTHQHLLEINALRAEVKKLIVHNNPCSEGYVHVWNGFEFTCDKAYEVFTPSIILKEARESGL